MKILPIKHIVQEVFEMRCYLKHDLDHVLRPLVKQRLVQHMPETLEDGVDTAGRNLELDSTSGIVSYALSLRFCTSHNF